MKNKLLIISYNSLLSSNANGRTITNLAGYNESFELAQLYFSADIPDYPDCKYYRITDNEILKSLALRQPGCVVDAKRADTQKITKIYHSIKAKRTNQCIRYLRQKLWGLGTWKTRKLWSWLDAFNPEAILLFSGNNAFIDKIAWKVSERYRIPIILYNCEDYYLKGPKNNTLFAKINKRFCDKVFRETMSKIKGVIYLTEYLKESYDAEFPASNSTVIMNTYNEYFDCEGRNIQREKSIVYLGNVGVGREYPLCQIADCLAQYGMKLDVYGNLPNENAKEKILSNPNINYHTPVPYAECCKIMCNSLLNIHCECFDEKYLRENKHAFSTKIPDSLACKTPFLVFAPKDISVSRYVQNNKCGFLCNSMNDLNTFLKTFLSNQCEIDSMVKKQREVAVKNHSKICNRQKFTDFISNIMRD